MRSRVRCLLAAVGVWAVIVGVAEAQTAVKTDGIVESTTGGFKFPDGTLQAVAVGNGVALVEDSGQQSCWGASGAPRPCTGTGEDGELQTGVDWPTPRFSANGDGTVTDNLTGLIWLQDANCAQTNMLWQAALDWVAAFNGGTPACTDYVAGTFSDWRLPGVNEITSLADYSQSSPAIPASHLFVNLETALRYWSSTSYVAGATLAWSLFMVSGDTGLVDKTQAHYVMLVRGGE